MHATDAIFTFKLGLHPSIAKGVIGKHANSLDEIIEKATEVYHFSKMKDLLSTAWTGKTPRRASPRRSPSRRHFKSSLHQLDDSDASADGINPENESGTSESDVEELLAMKDKKKFSKSNGKSGDSKRRPKGPPPPWCNEEQKKWWTDGLCLRCGGKHPMSLCPNPVKFPKPLNGEGGAR
jgi:hypothetical protein